MAVGGQRSWTYEHRDLDERPLPDGSRIRRPCAVISPTDGQIAFDGVLDSGSPLTVAGQAFAATCGIDLGSPPMMIVPLGVGGPVLQLPVFQVELRLLEPSSGAGDQRWSLPLVVQRVWRFPFAVLFGQRGWFDRFPTTIGPAASTVHLDRV